MTRENMTLLMDFLQMKLTTSDQIFDQFSQIKGAVMRGTGPERFLFVGGEREDRVLLVAHADTVWDCHRCLREKVRCPGENRCSYDERDIAIEDGVVRNRKGGLGADDRAGCAILWLLRDEGHSLLVTDGEESGRRGSSWLMAANPDIADEINATHRFVVQLDRRNARDFKCYSVGSDDFRRFVGESTGFSEPDRTSATDIVTLCRDVCGVNLSVGYYREHREDEHLVLGEWEHTLHLCREWLSRPMSTRFERQPTATCRER